MQWDAKAQLQASQRRRSRLWTLCSVVRLMQLLPSLPRPGHDSLQEPVGKAGCDGNLRELHPLQKFINSGTLHSICNSHVEANSMWAIHLTCNT
jgi:hypothetical protein